MIVGQIHEVAGQIAQLARRIPDALGHVHFQIRG
jgi:hypothetical protein